MRTAGQFDAAVRVSFKGQDVSGLSIMGLMMLAAGIGSSIELSCSGRQAAEAMTALSALVEEQVRRGLTRRTCGVSSRGHRPRDL